MIIKSAEFLKSATNPSQYFETDLSEIAFSGRSNAGKSSLINCLVNRKKLVKTSSTPGCTQLINFFLINNDFVFTDLPGYGYAKTPLSVRKKWQPMIEKYLTVRSNLKGVVIIVDIRRDIEKEENLFKEWLDYNKIPLFFVLTKADKISKSKQIIQKETASNKLVIDKSKIIIFSAKSFQGKEDVWAQINQVL